MQATHRHGSITTYIPRSKICGAAMSETANDCLALAVYLPGDEQLQIDFAASQQEEVQRLMDLLPTLSPARGA